MKENPEHINKPPAFQFYVKDWITDYRTRTLTPEEKGIYIDLLANSWLEEDTCLPNELLNLAYLCNADPEKVRKIVDTFFVKNDKKVYNKKLKGQKEKLMLLREKRQKIGKKGGLAKAKNLLKQKAYNPHEDEDEVEVEEEDSNKEMKKINKNIVQRQLAEIAERKKMPPVSYQDLK